ncbi:putative DNA helicase ino80 [Ophidiomyces ophidiicola]|uniref:DNA helicase ino80 n=1 Tax=Ophidiomyces ophidiicola TaxID=1387563 RepID=A0ACB8UZ62_9EURO|nr:putative DNA helicase ino80 [Ophidiomyces ophidiicola]KAI1949329.1 putative DNA helicase ino80 [Ophidiomyces ophidiicola]KAI1970961.1 putative DNA helicase ino80 [Ophidiomyces ophidiicola]KAI2006000.1 putative DNA helicase ino80 [Ophidiomyces ophidiicola]KAI2030740.1 putative DNA helicase ino80 [Ophidiomyces ophidiicola]
MTGGPPYKSHSPTQQPRYPPYSPTTRDAQSYSNNEAYQHPPSTPPAFPPPSASLNRSPRFARPASPIGNALPPLSGAVVNADGSPPYHGHSASTTPAYTLPRPFGGSLLPTTSHSPPPTYGHPSTSHTHPTNIADTFSHSPKRETDPYEFRANNGGIMGQPPLRPLSPKESKPARSNPMSFANILSGPADEPPSRRPSSPPQSYKSNLPPPLAQSIKTEKMPSLDPEQRRVSTQYDAAFSDVAHRPVTNGFSSSRSSVPPTALPSSNQQKTGMELESERISSQAVAKAMQQIEAVNVSDIEGPGFEDEWHRYISKNKKRARELELVEERKRKRRRTEFLGKLAKVFEKQALQGTERFNRVHEADVQSEIQQKEVQEEKERKKDMQRKRRRENTVRHEMEKLNAAQKKANKIDDEAEKQKLAKEIARSKKKIKDTTLALERGEATQEISEVNPIAPNLEGGTTSSFHIRSKSPQPKKKQTKTQSTRPKKSKEKKLAEKALAEAAYAEMENDDMASLAPKEDPRKASLKKDSKAARSKESSPVFSTPYDSKGYNQLYEQIWRDIARKDIPKVHRIKVVSLSTRQENLRKTAQLASKQSRKWQERTNRSMKDTQARAKRTMREMMSFWKRNEREERDMRRLAQRQELELAKKAEADREANRQRRKLNFLISQTELYSHFIGRKIKTDQAQDSGDATALTAMGEGSSKLPDSLAGLAEGGGKVTNFEDLDFDAEDDTVLRQAAMANAQNAVQEAQDRARAFNGEENKMAAFDDGEMNFQNPTSLGDVEVSQPKMLTCQLKEYQLKGLNWLVNLYEQGINGILADEMGLGKTVQSISVMSYLAEVHDIWGPFLVVAPSSTLHNWQQEIVKFVPDLKVLPYWGSAKDRKVLRKFWDRRNITYRRQSEFHVLVTSYQLVVGDAQYFQKIKWQYMILDEAQAIKSSQSSRWKSLLGMHCRNRLLLTGTPIQNNMQELWALLHFIMPTLFDSHDEFSEWFSKDIESHAQSNTKLNEDQLKRLHMILKPFMLRRIKKHVQKELGDKVEKDIFCDLTYRQRAYYANLRNRVSIMDLIEKAAIGDDTDSTTLMNLVMQFRKVCNHPDLFERADTTSPFSACYFAETASFVREGSFVNVGYSTRNLIEYDLPRLLCSPEARLDMAGPGNEKAGFQGKYLSHMMNIWTPENIRESLSHRDAFSWLRFSNISVGEAFDASHKGVFERAVTRRGYSNHLSLLNAVYDKDGDDDDIDPNSLHIHSMFNIVERNNRRALANTTATGYMRELLNISDNVAASGGIRNIEPCAKPGATAPPITISSYGRAAIVESQESLFSQSVRQVLFGKATPAMEAEILAKKLDPAPYSLPRMLPEPGSEKGRFTNITVPSMRRFVTDSGKLAKLDQLLRELKNGGHRVLLYFQMTRMIDLMEEYLTYRNYKYCRLDGSTKLEDRRDTVSDFQQRPEIFVFLLSTRAGGLGINLTAADTVIFYDSDWNPTIDSQAMDRAHRLGQTRQVTVYRLITRGTIEERIRKRALQKEEVQRVVISGGAAGGVDFNARSRENRTKDIAMWLADDEQAEILEQKEKEALEKGEEATTKKGKRGPGKRKRDITLDDMYHEGEGHFEDNSTKPSGAATPVSGEVAPGHPATKPRRGRGGGAAGAGIGRSKKAKTVKERLRLIDGEVD